MGSSTLLPHTAPAPTAYCLLFLPVPVPVLCFSLVIFLVWWVQSICSCTPNTGSATTHHQPLPTTSHYFQRHLSESDFPLTSFLSIPQLEGLQIKCHYFTTTDILTPPQRHPLGLYHTATHPCHIRLNGLPLTGYVLSNPSMLQLKVYEYLSAFSVRGCFTASVLACYHFSCA
jgi:hypothetical protein